MTWNTYMRMGFKTLDSLYHITFNKPRDELTISSSISSSSSGTCGGLKKLKKLSQFSVLVIGLTFFDPFFGFFFKIFCVKHLPGYHSISTLQRCTQYPLLSTRPISSCKANKSTWSLTLSPYPIWGPHHQSCDKF